MLPDIHPALAAERCPAVRAFEALRVAEAEYGRALDAGAGLFGPHHDAALDVADDFSRAVPTSRAGAALHLRNVARVRVALKDVDGALAPLPIAQEAASLADAIEAAGPLPALAERLGALHDACWAVPELGYGKPWRSRVWRSVAAALEWAAPARVRRPQRPAVAAPAPDPAEPDPAVRAYAAWQRASDEFAADSEADLLDAHARRSAIEAVEMACAAFVDAVPTTHRGALLKLRLAAKAAASMTEFEAPERDSPEAAEWAAAVAVAPELARLSRALESESLAPQFTADLARVAAIYAASMPASHAARRSIAATLRWARRPRAVAAHD